MQEPASDVPAVLVVERVRGSVPSGCRGEVAGGELGVAAPAAVPWLSVIGSAMGIVLFLSTLSFLFTTPGLTAARGFPVLSVLPGQFLLKDLVLVSASLWTLGDSLSGALPWRGRLTTESASDPGSGRPCHLMPVNTACGRAPQGASGGRRPASLDKTQGRRPFPPMEEPFRAPETPRPTP